MQLAIFSGFSEKKKRFTKIGFVFHYENMKRQSYS